MIELINDVGSALCPVDQDAARRMVRVSRFLTEQPELAELEMNPVVVLSGECGALAVDVLSRRSDAPPGSAAGTPERGTSTDEGEDGNDAHGR